MRGGCSVVAEGGCRHGGAGQASGGAQREGCEIGGEEGGEVGREGRAEELWVLAMNA